MWESESTAEQQEINILVCVQKKVKAVVGEEDKLGFETLQRRRATAEQRMWSQSSLQIVLCWEMTKVQPSNLPQPPARRVHLHLCTAHLWANSWENFHFCVNWSYKMNLYAYYITYNSCLRWSGAEHLSRAWEWLMLLQLPRLKHYRQTLENL